MSRKGIWIRCCDCTQAHFDEPDKYRLKCKATGAYIINHHVLRECEDYENLIFMVSPKGRGDKE